MPVTKWYGGKCPVKPGTPIFYTLMASPARHWTTHPENLHWGHGTPTSDIVEFYVDLSEIPCPSLGGWIDWSGDPVSPANADDLIAYVLRDGEEVLRGERASHLIWLHQSPPASHDIIAYCVVSTAGIPDDPPSPKTTNLSTPESAPTGNGTEIWPLVIEDMQQRDSFGREKYGTPLRAENGRNMLVDAYQEVLDLAVYLRGEIQNRNTLNEFRASDTHKTAAALVPRIANRTHLYPTLKETSIRLILETAFSTDPDPRKRTDTLLQSIIYHTLQEISHAADQSNP